MKDQNSNDKKFHLQALFIDFALPVDVDLEVNKDFIYGKEDLFENILSTPSINTPNKDSDDEYLFIRSG